MGIVHHRPSRLTPGVTGRRKADMCYWCETRKACLMCGKPLPTQAAPSSCTVDSIVVPRKLWERMRLAIFRISCGREVCAGSPAYDPGLCDKAAVDKLVDDIQRHNDEFRGGGTPSAGTFCSSSDGGGK